MGREDAPWSPLIKPHQVTSPLPGVGVTFTLLRACPYPHALLPPLPAADSCAFFGSQKAQFGMTSRVQGRALAPEMLTQPG